MATPIQIVFDANNPARLAEFWAVVLGYVIQPPPDGFDSWDDWARAMEIPEENWNDARALVDPDGAGPRIFFQRVPESKTAKNRVHLDVNAGGGQDTSIDERRSRVDAEVERIIAAGASVIRPMEQRGEYWIVLGDPEGNEFCVQ
ncbi:MAG: VOC family protein [Actinomycetota bacterium]|nr:VOC family protein [Actinomycetota bacterium]